MLLLEPMSEPQDTQAYCVMECVVLVQDCFCFCADLLVGEEDGRADDEGAEPVA